MLKPISFVLLLILPQAQAKCVGRVINPVTDICWSCIFPITIAGLKVSRSGEDTPNSRRILCNCSRPIP